MCTGARDEEVWEDGDGVDGALDNIEESKQRAYRAGSPGDEPPPNCVTTAPTRQAFLACLPNHETVPTQDYQSETIHIV